MTRLSENVTVILVSNIIRGKSFAQINKSLKCLDVKQLDLCDIVFHIGVMLT